jgi:hypothetical protein
MSSLLISRYAFPKATQAKEEPPHRSWGIRDRAAIVILWGLLVYPQLDPDLKRQNRTYWVNVEQLAHLFQDYLGDRKQCLKILHRLKEHDYIRMKGDEEIIPGTGLFASVDAAKMYRYFRSSVLARKFFQLEDAEN